jgi:hypothetical protein
MLNITDFTARGQAEALAVITRAEVAQLTGDLRGNWTAREASLIGWMAARTTVTVDSDTSVTVTGPAGRAVSQFGYLLYVALERATNALEVTPWAIDFDTFLGEDLATGGRMTW